MAVSQVVVVDGNNLIVRIDRGVAGRGVTDVEPIEIDGSLYLVFTFSDGTTETVGPVGTIQYIGQSPIVVTGSTISLSTVPVTLGGTGQITANAGFNALAPSQTGNSGKYLKTDGTNSAWDLLDISTADITGVLPLANGGTGSSTASGARTNLGLGTIATQNANAVSITGGTITGITDLAVADGGTGASTAAGAMVNLLPSYTGNANKRLGLDGTATGLEWVTDGGGTVTSVDVSGGATGLLFTGGPVTTSGTITLSGTLDVDNGGTGATTATDARTNLGAAASAITINAGTGLSGGGDLTANRTLSITNTGVTAASYGSASNTLTATVNAQGQLTTLAATPIAISNTQVSGLGTMSTQNSNNVTITGGSITGITDLAIADGGTGASTAADARSNLGLGTAAVLNAGVANGVATLDAGGTVPLSQIPASIQGGVNYQGSWNAATNTPTIVSGVGSKGYYYVVSVAGSTNIDGITDWLPGDWIIFNGTTWEQIDNTDAVASVNGYTGVVVLTNTDVGAPPTSLTISAGTGLTGGGNLTTNRTLSIANTTVAAGSYGDAASVGTFTVNGQGQLTAAATTPIAITNTQVSGLGTMSTQNANSVSITGGTITGITDLAIADGGTGASTANAAFNNLAPSQTGNSGKYLTTDGSNTSWATNPLGTVTSVDVSGGTTGLTTTGGPVTSSGTITLGGTLAVANGGTGATTAGGALTNLGAIGTITSTDGSIVVTPTGTTVDLAVSEASPASTLLTPVRNTTGSTLLKGTVVYISGATGQIATVSKALATSDATSAQTLGMITTDLPNNTNGYVTVIGLITNIDTSAYTDGQQLYLSGTTAGAVTGTKPYAPIHLVYVAVVEYAHPTQGKLFVKVQNGYELDELHNVSAQTPSNGQTIVYNSSNSLWENNTVSLTLGVNGVLPIANGGTGQTTANAAFNALAPSQTGNSGKYLTTDGTNTSWGTNPLGTVTSVGGTGTVSGISLSGTVTTSGNLTLGGALDLSAYNGAGAFTTLSASSTVTLSGGTANGVTYLNGSKVLTSGSALTFNGSTLATSNANASFTSGSATTAGVITSGAAVTQGVIQFGSGQTTYNIQGGPDYIGNVYNVATGSSHQWAIAASEQMRLTSTGLGIGTNSISEKLNVVNSGSYAAIRVSNGTNSSLFGYANADGNYNAGAKAGDAIIRGAVGVSIEGNNGTSGMRLDASGNLGLGVTPSAWGSPFKGMQLGTSASAFIVGRTDTNPQAQFGVNMYYNGTNWVYTSATSLTASRYVQSAGSHIFYSSTAGTAGNTVSETQAATLTADGNFLVGVTSGSFRLSSVVPSGANRDIFGAQIEGASNGFTIKWNHSTTTTRVNIQNLPTSATGLASGDLYVLAGALMVA